MPSASVIGLALALAVATGALALLATTLVRRSRALRAAEERARRARELARVGEPLELDEVLERGLETAVRLLDADAAGALLEQVAERPLAVTLGLAPEEEDAPLGADSFGEGARAIIRRFLPPPEADAVTAVQGAVSVPLGPPEARLGTLTVFRRGRPFESRSGDLDVLEELAGVLAPAIEVGRRFREAATLADVDALTRLRSRRFFHQMLESELARARRYGRRLAVMVLDIDDFKSVNERIGHLEADRLLADVGRQIAHHVRAADTACRVGGDEFAVILPESGAEHAQRLYRRIEAALAAAPVHPPLHLSAGIAELGPADEDGRMLFCRADAALFEAKGGGKGVALRAVTSEEPN